MRIFRPNERCPFTYPRSKVSPKENKQKSTPRCRFGDTGIPKIKNRLSTQPEKKKKDNLKRNNN